MPDLSKLTTRQWLLLAAGLFLLSMLDLGDPTPSAKAGPRTILLVREASDVTPAMARAEGQLRAGDAAKYLAEKKHKLLILSDDQGLPPTLTPKAKEAFAKAKAAIPAIAVVDDSSGSSAAVEQIKPDASVDDILAVVKKYGG